MTQPTLARRMILSLGCMVVGSLAVGVGSLFQLNQMHQDLSASVLEYRQLRQLFDVGFLVSRAREAVTTDPPQPQKAILALRAALAKLNERSDPHAVDGPPSQWIDESSRRDCQALMTRSIEQLGNGSGDTTALNLAFGRLSRVADDVRSAIYEAQLADNRTQHSARRAIIMLDIAVIVIALVVGMWQYHRVIDPIRELTKGMRAFAGGDLDRRINLRGDLEFVALAVDFDNMAGELSTLYRGLEAKVADKTRHLLRSEQLASVGYLAASVSHEINNPLGIIAGYCERALQRLDGTWGESTAADTRRALQVICEEAFRCKQITDRLLSLARPGSAEQTLISLAVTAQTVIATLRGLSAEQGSKLTLIADLKGDFSVLANEGEIKQLLLNLLINSIEAVDPVKGEIVVSLHRRDNEIELSIKDSGRGMSAQILSRVFEPFFSDNRGRRGGTGLGLSIAQSIATEHGGLIQAHSDGPQTGSTFILKLPAARTEAAVGSI